MPPVGAHRHLGAPIARGDEPSIPTKRHDRRLDTFVDPRERKAQYVGGRRCYHRANRPSRATEGETAMIEAGDIGVILLAAGRSRRFEAPTSCSPPRRGHAAGFPRGDANRRTGARTPDRRVPRCRCRASRRVSAALGFEIAVNADAAAGLSRSLACGIAAAARGNEAAALVVLADMPFVTATHLRELLVRFDPSKTPVVASTDGRTAMPPALFARSLFGRLQAGAGDRGGKALLDGAALVTAPPGELADIDLPGDIRQRQARPTVPVSFMRCRAACRSACRA